MAGETAATAGGKLVASGGGLELVAPSCDAGIGSVIGSIDSPDLIAGVRLRPLTIYPDDRGYFVEIQRLGGGLAAEFPAASTQISAALSYPGTIKAFHYHLHQADLWSVLKGMLQVALVDLRAGSATFGARNTIYAGALRPWQVLIPAGVAHGYKAIGPDEAVLVYLTDRFYNPRDEGRIPYNDPSINYDWAAQWK
jgi:dTDP-4-dehydrorhamnose 3,5-epimerase